MSDLTQHNYMGSYRVFDPPAHKRVSDQGVYFLAKEVQEQLMILAISYYIHRQD